MHCFSFCDKRTRFSDLTGAVHHCSLCSRLAGRAKVLSGANGNIDSKVLFVAEAPGRLGADRTGVPLHGDRTGENFEALLGNIGWKREEVFITNAVLCNPREEDGNNATPSKEEIENCSAYLEMTIELVQPNVVVSLGASALKALSAIHPHSLNLTDHVAKLWPWAGRHVVPLYHPGPRALVHRSLARQRSDFMQLAKLIHPTIGVPKRRSSDRLRQLRDTVERTPLAHLVCAIVHSLGRITYFRLAKLLYLTDLLALTKLGHTLSGEIYLRQPEGPWPPALRDAVRALDGYEVACGFQRQAPIVSPGPSPRFRADLDEDALEIVAEALERYGHLTNAEIKTAAYTTAPMRYLLRQEKAGRDMRRVPVIYKNKAAPQADEST